MFSHTLYFRTVGLPLPDSATPADENNTNSIPKFRLNNLPFQGEVVTLTGKLYADESTPITREQAAAICVQLGAYSSTSAICHLSYCVA